MSANVSDRKHRITLFYHALLNHQTKLLLILREVMTCPRSQISEFKQSCQLMTSLTEMRRILKYKLKYWFGGNDDIRPDSIYFF